MTDQSRNPPSTPLVPAGDPASSSYQPPVPRRRWLTLRGLKREREFFEEHAAHTNAATALVAAQTAFTTQVAERDRQVGRYLRIDEIIAEDARTEAHERAMAERKRRAELTELETRELQAQKQLADARKRLTIARFWEDLEASEDAQSRKRKRGLEFYEKGALDAVLDRILTERDIASKTGDTAAATSPHVSQQTINQRIIQEIDALIENARQRLDDDAIKSLTEIRARISTASEYPT